MRQAGEMVVMTVSYCAKYSNHEIKSTANYLKKKGNFIEYKAFR